MNISSAMMTNSPLYVAFLWHMHQPFYRDPITGVYRLPWVRLHGTKDYLDMVEILTDFPHIRQTFNFTPSLLEQIIGYTENHAIDRHLELTLKKASDLDMDDRAFILENFYLANWDNMVKPFPRYYELLLKRGFHLVKGDLMRMAKYFSTNDFLDLQVRYNLCWTDPLFRKKDPVLNALADKQRKYTEEDKNLLKMGLDYFEGLFSYRPVGMWPSEGAVSEEVVKIAGKEGIKWMGTDEDILSNSLNKRLRDSSGNIIEPENLYRPYMFDNVSLIFRDRHLSDLIGFVYHKWDPKKAAEDLLNKFLSLQASLPKDKPHLLSIILDGENAWEHYKNDGHDFLRYLYEGLSKEERLRTDRISEYIEEYGSGEPLGKLYAGSWINANYGIWIGHEEDNRAWDYLSDTRNDLELFQKLNPEKDVSEAWKAIYIAEGSDWNWWYGDEHTTETQRDFDELFRLNLIKVYKEMGKEVPQQLFVPVTREDRSIPPMITIRGFIEPKIDGIVTSYYEWYQGAYMDVRKFGGSMHIAESIISHVYYGFNKDNFFLRIDPTITFREFPDDTKFSIYVLKPIQFKIIVPIKPSSNKAELIENIKGAWVKVKDLTDFAIQDIFELKIAFHDLKAKEKDEMNVFVCIDKNSVEVERCPLRGYITFAVPTPEFEAMMW